MARAVGGFPVFFLLFLSLTRDVLVISAWSPTPKYAVITPVDKLVFIGETVKMKCKIISSLTNATASDAFFEIFISPEMTIRVPKENTTAVDNVTILSAIQIDDRFDDQVTVTCRTETQAKLAGATIYVERPIQNVTDFQGVFFYDNNTIVTTWSLGSYLDPSRINVTVDYSSLVAPNMSDNRCVSSTNEFCRINWSGADSFFFRISISIQKQRPGPEELVPLYQTSLVSVHMFRPNDHMKTGPVMSPEVVNLNSTCVSLVWKDSSFFTNSSFYHTIYRLEIKKEDETEFKLAVDNGLKNGSADVVQYCGLEPDTKYSLSLRVRAFSMNPWSDQTVVKIQTDEDRPKTGPPVTDTSYHVGECEQNKRDVYIYWKDQPKSSLCGQLSNFSVIINNSQSNYTVPVRKNANFYRDTIDCDSAYDMQVYSATSLGYSLEPSTFSIPKESEELTLPKDFMFRVQESSSEVRSIVNVTVLWNSGTNTDNFTLILYMCMETLPLTCFDDFNTTEVPLAEKQMVLPNLSSYTNLFGYALKNDKGQKRGIQWTNCVYRPENLPGKPAGLYVAPGSQPNSLLISWIPSQCNKNTKVLILQYHIFICPKPVDVSLTGKHCQSIIISNMSVSNYVAKNLKGGQKYYVYIQAKSTAGVGPLSDPVVEMASVSSNDRGEVVGIVLGSLMGLSVLIALVFFLIRCCCKSKRRVKSFRKEKKFTPMVAVSKTPCFPNSSESGVYTGSTRNSADEETHQPNVPDRMHIHTGDEAVDKHDCAIIGETLAGTLLRCAERESQQRQICLKTQSEHQTHPKTFAAQGECTQNVTPENNFEQDTNNINDYIQVANTGIKDSPEGWPVCPVCPVNENEQHQNCPKITLLQDEQIHPKTIVAAGEPQVPSEEKLEQDMTNVGDYMQVTDAGFKDVNVTISPATNLQHSQLPPVASSHVVFNVTCGLGLSSKVTAPSLDPHTVVPSVTVQPVSCPSHPRHSETVSSGAGSSLDADYVKYAVDNKHDSARKLEAIHHDFSDSQEGDTKCTQMLQHGVVQISTSNEDSNPDFSAVLSSPSNDVSLQGGDSCSLNENGYVQQNFASSVHFVKDVCELDLSLLHHITDDDTCSSSSSGGGSGGGSSSGSSAGGISSGSSVDGSSDARGSMLEGGYISHNLVELTDRVAQNEALHLQKSVAAEEDRTSVLDDASARHTEEVVDEIEMVGTNQDGIGYIPLNVLEGNFGGTEANC